MMQWISAWASAERISWYEGKRQYSRRELLADACVHLIGVSASVTASSALLVQLAQPLSPAQPPLQPAVRLALQWYSGCLPTMWLSSAVYNGFAWSEPTRLRRLKLLDHAGICVMIVGSMAPFMALCGCFRLLTALTTFAVANVAQMAAMPNEVGALHLVAFLAMGWCMACVREHLQVALSPWAQQRCLLGGALYTTGLVPFASSRLEFHTAIWHLHVLAACAAIHLVLQVEVGS